MTETAKHTVIEEIEAERKRQISVEGWTPAHDDGHVNGEMARAAACYAVDGLASSAFSEFRSKRKSMVLSWLWPWAWEWWKPRDHRRNLVKAGALIVAEIERLDRAALAKTGATP